MKTRKLTEEGYKWRYEVERKKVKELQAEVRSLTYQLHRVSEAHAKTAHAWYLAETRYDRLYENWCKERQSLPGQK